MKYILLPTDFSDNSWNAIQYAVQLFENESCDFTLLNTYNQTIHKADPILGYSPQVGLDEAIRDEAFQNLNEIVNRISETIGDNPKHTFKTFFTLNNLVSGINIFLTENMVNLIVMGTHGASGTRKLLIGSNTVNVFKEVKCPTLSIPADYEYEKLEEILFPTDLLVDYNNFHIEALKDIASTNKCRINVLHISTLSLTTKQVETKLALKSQFEKMETLFHLKSGNSLLAAIDEFQIKSKVSLLAMLSNKHTFFEKIFFKSNIEQIGFHLKIPFLVIPAKAKN